MHRALTDRTIGNLMRAHDDMAIVGLMMCWLSILRVHRFRISDDDNRVIVG